MTTLVETADTTSSPRPLLGLLALLVSFSLVGLTLLALILPWVWNLTPGGAQLARYLPMQNGHSLLYAVEDAPATEQTLSGWQPQTWQSDNARTLPVGQAVANVLDEDLRDALVTFYETQSGQTFTLDAFAPLIQGSVVYQQRSQAVDRTGAITTTVALFVRNAEGDYLIGLQDEANAQTFLFTPAPLYLPADLEVGRTWETSGQLGEGRYRFEGTILAAASYDSPLGRYEECLHLEQHLTLSRDEVTLSDQVDRSWICAGIGSVATESLDENGSLIRRSLLVAATHLPEDIRQQVSAHATLLPPMSGSPLPDMSATPLDDWQMGRLGRTLPAGQTGENTIAPVWIPGDPPLVLGAAYLGDLVAFNAASTDGDIRWRYHPGGTIYSRPSFDPETGMIYFGASDKQLYALSREGLFLWSRPMGDNIATSPLVVDDIVIVGSEDRRIYGVDAHSGALRWQVPVGGPVVSSPALAAGRVIIGADDGVVYALEPQTGEQLWRYDSGDPIEAAIVAADDVVFVANRGKQLFALHAEDGSTQWTVETRYALHTAPAVDAEQVYIVDDFGDLSAYGRHDGRWHWTIPNQGFVGPPLLTAETIFAAGSSGLIHQLDQTGKTIANWQPDSATEQTSYAFGPIQGGDALWLATEDATLQRLGSPLFSAPVPQLVHSYNWLAAPFARQSFITTALADGDTFLVLDSGNMLYRIDPDDGATRIGQIGDGLTTLTDPLLVDDLLLAPVGSQLVAISLPNGNERWRFEGIGVGINPPVIHNGLGLWLLQDDATQQQTLYAVDLATGAARWQISTPVAPILGGMAVDDKAVYLSTPPMAFDLDGGKLRWQLDTARWGVGRPLLSADGGTLFIGMIEEDGNTGLLLALDPLDGTILWEQTLPGLLGPLEQMWQDEALLIVPLYLSTGEIVAVNTSDGSERWRYRPPVSRLGTVSLIGNRLWVPLQDGRIVLVDAASGEKIVTLGDAGANLNSSSYAQRPTAADGWVLVPLVDQMRLYRQE